MRTAFPILGEFDHRFRPEHRRRHSLWTKELGTPHRKCCPPSRSSVFRLYPACTRRRNRQEPRSNPLQGIDLQPARCTLACLATAFDRPPLGSWSMMTSPYSSNAITFSMYRRNPWTYGTDQQKFAQPLACPARRSPEEIGEPMPPIGPCRPFPISVPMDVPGVIL